MGTNPNAAYLAGINVRNMRLSVYVIMGFLVGIGALLLLSRINTGIITLGQGLEIDTIAMVVIGGTALSGGKGSMLGTLIGIFFLGSIGNAMNMLRMPSEVQFVAKGMVVIIAVIGGRRFLEDLRVPGATPGEGAGAPGHRSPAGCGRFRMTSR